MGGRRGKRKRKPSTPSVQKRSGVPLLSWAMDHPKISAVIACIAIAVTLSGKVSMWGVYIFLAIAAMFGLSFVHGLKIKRIVKYGSDAVFLIALALLSGWLTGWLTSKPHLMAAQDPHYPQPKGPGIRIDTHVPTPSRFLCQGLSEQAEIDCLCPRPLNYALAAAAPTDDSNYATEVIVNRSREPMYRIRMFSRAPISSWQLLEPTEEAVKAKGACIGPAASVDPYSMTMQCTFPLDRFRIGVHTSEGLRLKCITQEN